MVWPAIENQHWRDFTGTGTGALKWMDPAPSQSVALDCALSLIWSASALIASQKETWNLWQVLSGWNTGILFEDFEAGPDQISQSTIHLWFHLPLLLGVNGPRSWSWGWQWWWWMEGTLMDRWSWFNELKAQNRSNKQTWEPNSRLQFNKIKTTCI